MCGFAGFTGYLENGEEVLTNMMNKIIHRGPDSAGQHIDGKAYMGFRRLSIIDLDNGSQPMYNEDRKIVITFNGEIYNHQDLRKDLIEKGHTFANNSDTEVLIHAYEEYGEDMLSKLRGMIRKKLTQNTRQKKKPRRIIRNSTEIYQKKDFKYRKIMLQ